MRVVLIFLLMGGDLVFGARGPGENQPVGARSAGIAHASVMLDDFWCFHHNQAALAYIHDLSVGFHHQSGYVKEMDHQTMAVIVPAASGSLAASVNCYGYRHYRQTKAALAYGRQLARFFTAGVQIDYFNTTIAGIYGESHYLTFETGLHYRINKRWCVGAHLFNPVRTFSGGKHQAVQMPTVFRAGAGVSFSGRGFLCFEAEKDLGKKVIPKLALEYELAPKFYVRTGVSLNPVLNCFGMGYTWKGLQADIAYAFHPFLGRIPNFSMTYAF